LFQTKETWSPQANIQLLVADLWFSPGVPVSSTNKIDNNDITESGIKQPNPCFYNIFP